MTTLERILKIAKENPNGFTVEIENFTSFKKGYCVAYKETQNSFGIEGAKKVIEFAKTHSNIVGGWKGENGFYFDCSMIINDLEQAIKKGRENEQIAIYDLELQKVIMI